MMLYVNVLYGVLALFIMVGILLGKEQAVFGSIIMAVVWAFTDIVHRAYVSLCVIREKRVEKNKAS